MNFKVDEDTLLLLDIDGARSTWELNQQNLSRLGTTHPGRDGEHSIGVTKLATLRGVAKLRHIQTLVPVHCKTGNRE